MDVFDVINNLHIQSRNAIVCQDSKQPPEKVGVGGI